jgi:hypothetical protein
MSPRRNWDSPNPSPASECALPPRTKGCREGYTRLQLREWGSPNSDDWRKSLALCLLCAYLSSRNLTTPSTQMNGSDSFWLRWSLGRGGSNGGAKGGIEGVGKRVLNGLLRTRLARRDMSPPLPRPPSPVSKLSLFLSLKWVSPVELTDGRGGRGWGRSQIVTFKEIYCRKHYSI